jgi:hypothetical protein
VIGAKTCWRWFGAGFPGLRARSSRSLCLPEPIPTSRAAAAVRLRWSRQQCRCCGCSPTHPGVVCLGALTFVTCCTRPQDSVLLAFPSQLTGACLTRAATGGDRPGRDRSGVRWPAAANHPRPQRRGRSRLQSGAVATLRRTGRSGVRSPRRSRRNSSIRGLSPEGFAQRPHNSHTPTR